MNNRGQTDEKGMTPSFDHKNLPEMENYRKRVQVSKKHILIADMTRKMVTGLSYNQYVKFTEAHYEIKKVTIAKS